MNINREIRSGAFYVFIFKYSEIFSHIVITAILARLLSPKEFGVVAIVTVFTNFFFIISDSGLGVGVIQKRGFTNKDFFSLFVITAFVGLFVAILFYFSGYFIADFYDNNVYIKISALLSFSLFFNTINTVPSAMLSREKKFKAIGIRKVAVEIIAGVFAIFLAYDGFSYYSIIYRSILVSILLFLIDFRLSGLKFTRSIHLNVVKEIFSYSLYQFLFSVVNYFSRNADNLLIGKILGPVSLGYYDRAYKLMLMPISSLTQVITPVLHPVLAIHQDNPELIYNVYSKIVKFLSLIGFPLSILLFFSAKEIVTIMYGNQWQATIPAFKLLALTVGIQMVYVSAGSIFQVLGKTNYLFSAGLFSSLITILAVLVGVFIGKSIYVVSFMLILAFIINFFQRYYLLIVRSFRKTMTNFFTLLYPGIIISIGIFILNFILVSFVTIKILILSLIIKVILFILVYLVLLVVLREYDFFISFIVPSINKK